MMDRRKFIGVSGISLIGISPVFSTASRIISRPSDGNTTDFLMLTGAKKSVFSMSQEDNDMLQNQCCSWIKSGYTQSHPDFCWKTEKNILIPLELSGSSNKLLDQVLLVFERSGNGSLSYTGVISGFHQEVFVKNKTILQTLGDASVIAESVFPTAQKGKPVPGGWMYYTKRGSFELSVMIDSGKTSLSSALISGQKSLWNNSILSDHTLYCGSATMI